MMIDKSMIARAPASIRSLPEELPVPAEFRQPPPGYGPVPLWFWNARLDEDEVRRQIREMREKGCAGAFVCARHGLQTPFLSEEWLRLARAAVEESVACGFQLWLHDEPDASADATIALHPEFRARSLQIAEHLAEGAPLTLPIAEAPSSTIRNEKSEIGFLSAWAVPLGSGDEPAGESRRLTPESDGRIAFDPGDGRWRVLLFTVAEAEGADALNPDASALLLRLTRERYARAVGRHFGRTIPGIFTGDAAPRSASDRPGGAALPWSSLLPGACRERCGYDLLDHLPALAAGVPGAARVRCDYFATLSALYTRHFLALDREWCAAHRLAATGHPLAEEPLAPRAPRRADAAAACRCLDIPGVGNRTAATGGVRHRLAASIAHQSGRDRVFSETFGGGGWGTTLAQRKASADWQLANGINLFVPHAVYYSVYGKRKRDDPPSEFEQEPFWPHYRHFADYLSRLSFLLTRGKHAARIAVLFPSRSARAHFAAGGPPLAEEERPAVALAGFGAPDRLLLARIEKDLQALCDLLAQLHFDFDFVDEEGLAEARIDRSRLCLGPERYELLLLPSMTTCRRRTWERVRGFFEAGGNVLSCGLLPYQTGEGEENDAWLRAEVLELTTMDPTRVEHFSASSARAMGRAAMRPLKVNRDHGSRVARYVPSAVPLPEQRALLMKTLLRTLAAIDVDLDCGDIVCHQRETADGKIIFLANTADAPRRVKAVFYALGHPEEWDAETGEVRRLWQYARAGEKVTMPLRFAPHQSRVIVFTGRDGVRVERANFHVRRIIEQEEHYLVEGEAWDYDRPLDTPPNCSLAREGGGRWAEGIDQGLVEPVALGEVWDLRVLGDNYLVLEDWRFHVPRSGQDPALLSTFQEHWPELPRRRPITGDPDLEPLERELPDEVWLQTRFHLDAAPRGLSLLLEPLDVPYSVFVNGHEVVPLQTGVLDPRFLTADVADVAVEGENVVALRLSHAGARALEPDSRQRITCDLVPEPARLLGEFTALTDEEGSYRVYPGTPEQITTGDWCARGFPHYSGALEYSQMVTLSTDHFGCQLVLACEDPAVLVQVLVNGKPAGTCLWPPYALDVSDLLFAGVNQITLRVTNTAANALLGEARPSGLLGPVRIEPYTRLSVPVPKE
ncbi:MAG: hypothetical protein HY321_22500 [Armatimonadetes bacterium]|nr:hypothetical protein [Armatimonadota bacterium]